MAKVKDLIKDSVFIKADGFDDLRPEVTVALPTFRRGDNGLFKRATESILAQTFKNFELIIIDDASTDSTFLQIQDFLKKDNRVSVIRHKQNIGLPAVSELEAFFKSRCNRFFYAFDDDEFFPDAIETLTTYLNDNPAIKMVHGAIDILKYTIFGAESYTLRELYRANFIPNPGVLLERSVLEDVGLYDPHFAIIGACDWDLWIRIAKKYAIGRVDKLLGIEKGRIQSDSLGNVYKIDHSVIFEYISTSRNTELLPENILEYEVDNTFKKLTTYSQFAIREFLKNKFSDKFWYQKKETVIKQEGYIVCVCKNCDKYREYITTCEVKLVFMEYVMLNEISILKFLLNASLIIVIGNHNDVYLHKIVDGIFNVCRVFRKQLCLCINTRIKVTLLDEYASSFFSERVYAMYSEPILWLLNDKSITTIVWRFIKRCLFPKSKKFTPYSYINVKRFVLLKFAILTKKELDKFMF
jgi:glycosyltransferase involved in cell wall biosynthesis